MGWLPEPQYSMGWLPSTPGINPGLYPSMAMNPMLSQNPFMVNPMMSSPIANPMMVNPMMNNPFANPMMANPMMSNPFASPFAPGLGQQNPGYTSIFSGAAINNGFSAPVSAFTAPGYENYPYGAAGMNPYAGMPFSAFQAR